MNKTNKTFEDSLKSIETENRLDRIFYRPIGYRISLILSKTSITPNAITILSIFVGVGGGVLFYHQNIWINLAGFALLVMANILDCVDGQLARLTGIKSNVGRILDGLAGNFWFISIYISLALRLSADISPAYAWTLMVLTGLSNMIQSNITDYYKTAHLYFISKEKGSEFETADGIRAKHSSMPYGLNKFLYWLYMYYTIFQGKITRELHRLLLKITNKYGEDFPEDIRLRLRKMSLDVMPLFNITTFNGRSVALLVAILLQQIWVYIAFEIVVLNIILIVAMRKYEANCKRFEV